ncbi:MAG: MipA/OmpV family protein [Proteobacteria bacterium]|nr:MipA/OmpV family protein [Pseudomonadota bacterium]MDA0928044.1 MipA/OmpV family protein [Pseudomonadota bacterium]
MRYRDKCWIVGILFIFATTATAGEAPSRPVVPTGWQYDLGLGLIANPEYQGSDNYRLLPVPYFDVRYVDERGTKTFFNVPQGFGSYFVRERLGNGDRFAVSGAVAPGFQNRDTDDFAGLETFGLGIEARLGAEYDTGPWSFQAGLAQAVASGHEGLYGNLSASYRFVLGRGAFVGIGPSLRFGNTNYMSALYGVTPDESLASGLAAFNAESGLESAAIQGLLSFPVGSKWRFTGVARAGELVGDAGDSSLTSETTQFFIVAAFTRRL